MLPIKQYMSILINITWEFCKYWITILIITVSEYFIRQRPLADLIPEDHWGKHLQNKPASPKDIGSYMEVSKYVIKF